MGGLFERYGDPHCPINKDVYTCINIQACGHTSAQLNTCLKYKQALFYTHAHTTHRPTHSHRMWSSPLRLFARCRSIGIECGQGGFRIDRWPLQRCAHWELGEGERGRRGGGPSKLSALPDRREVLLYMSTADTQTRHGLVHTHT